MPPQRSRWSTKPRVSASRYGPHLEESNTLKSTMSGASIHDSRKHKICPPFYGESGPAYTRVFKTDFTANLWSEVDDGGQSLAEQASISWAWRRAPRVTSSLELPPTKPRPAVFAIPAPRRSPRCHDGMQKREANTLRRARFGRDNHRGENRAVTTRSPVDNHSG